MKKKNELGVLIRREREGFRLTQRELARKLGVKASHVAYIEGGLRRPSLSLVRRLADTLGLNKQKLLLLTYPEARFLIAQPPKPSPGDPEAAWRLRWSPLAVSWMASFCHCVIPVRASGFPERASPRSSAREGKNPAGTQTSQRNSRSKED